MADSTPTFTVKDITATDVATLFNKAEKALKKVERIHADLIIPSINELRYAGCHLTRHIQSPVDHSELIQAANHCKRAMYDCYEAGIYHFLNSVNLFQKDYRNIVISDVMPEWITLKVRISEIKTFFSDVDTEKREALFLQCEQYFNELGIILGKLDSAREDLNKKIKKERIQTLVVWMTLFMLLLVTLTFFGLNRTNSSPAKQTAPTSSSQVSPSEALQNKQSIK